MIDTIFYFPSSLTFEEYTSQLQSGDIAERTIVFADEQKSIYKGGKKYGGWSTQEFHEKMSEYENYDDSWINDEINGIKADILGAKGRIDALNAIIENLNGRLNDDIENIDSDIQSKVEEMFGDSEWIQEHFPQGVTSWDQGWNAEIEAYLRLVGYWDIDALGNKTTKWSKLQQAVDSISLSVNDLTTNGNLSNAIQASIEAMIQGDIAELNLGTTYAKVEDVDNVHNVIEWLYSGLKSSSGPDKTFAQLVSAGKNGLVSAISELRTSVDLLNGVAGADLTAKVNNVITTLLLQTANDNALAALAAKADANSDDISAILLAMTGSGATADIQTRIGDVLSGFASTADVSGAVSEIYSAISAKDNSDNFISLSALKTSVDANTATLSAITQNGNNTSGFVTRSGLDDAVAELFAASGNPNNYDAKASVIAYVKDNKSSLELNANDVNINGYLTAGNATFKGNIEANQFTTGASNESGISVMTGNFSPATANTNKAYFAYDSTQGAVTMWFYKDSKWQRIDLTTSAVSELTETFIAETFYTISDNATSIPDNPTSVTLYYGRISGKYYTTESTSNPATGTYYKISRFDNLADAKRTHNWNSYGSPHGNNCLIMAVYTNNNVIGLASEICPYAYATRYYITSGDIMNDPNLEGQTAVGAYAMTNMYSTTQGGDFEGGIVGKCILVPEVNNVGSYDIVGLDGFFYKSHSVTTNANGAYNVYSFWRAGTLGEAVLSPTPLEYAQGIPSDPGAEFKPTRNSVNLTAIQLQYPS